MTEEKKVGPAKEIVEKTTKKQLGGATGKGFMPGVSGNPAGRPKGSFGLTTLLKQKLQEIPIGQVKGYGDQVIEKLLELAIVKGDTNALKIILNYADGMPRQTIGLDGGEEGEPIAISVETAGIVNEALSKFLGVVPTEEENEVDADGEAPVVEAPVVE